MTSIGATKADQLEALVYTIENATSQHTRLVVRNSEAWIASATQKIVATPTIDQAREKALADALKFGTNLPHAAATNMSLAATGTGVCAAPAEDIEALRLAALDSVRAFQASLLDAAPGETSEPFHC